VENSVFRGVELWSLASEYAAERLSRENAFASKWPIDVASQLLEASVRGKARRRRTGTLVRRSVFRSPSLSVSAAFRFVDP
jgi:hypothetical protein